MSKSIINDNEIIIQNDISSHFFTYKSHNFQSNEINTLSLGGGGYYGILNIALIKHLEDLDEIKNIKYIYSVSVGTLFGLLIILGFTSKECSNLILNDLALDKLVEIQPKNIFHLIDKLGINDGSYLETTIKNNLQKRGFSPYITFKELYELTDIEFNVGVSFVFKKNFEIINYKSYPDMPIWLALRASTSIPLVFQPLYDIEHKDYLCDGGILCNNPIKYALLNTININNEKYNENNNLADTTPLQFPLMKYKCNVISTDFKFIQSFENINKPSLIQYITAISRKIFVNQSGYDNRFNKLIHLFNMEDYPEINYTNLKLDKSQLETIINRGYKELETFFENIKN